MAQGVYHRALSAKARVLSQISPCEVSVRHTGIGTGFLPHTSVSLVCVITTMLHTHLHLHVPLTRKTTWRIWEPSERNAFSEIGKYRIENNLHLVFKGLSPLILYEQIKPSDSIDAISGIEGA